MTTTQYRNFVTVAECRSITGAAKELMIAQPALTNQIKRIEQEFGAPLFIRYPRSVELTEAGRALYQAAKNILQIEDNASIEITNLSSGDGGTLRIGITLFMPDPFFEKLLHCYYRQYPDVSVSLYEENADELLGKLEDGVIELAVITSPRQPPPEFRVIASNDNYLFACHSYGSPFLTGKKDGEVISLSDLKGIPISAPRVLYRYIGECCRRLGFSPIWKAISDSRHATLQLAEHGSMVAVLAKWEGQENSHLICHPVSDEALVIKRYFVVLEGRSLSRTTQNFIQILNSVTQ